MANEDEELKQSLLKDLSQAEKTVSSGAQASGLPGDQFEIKAKAVRIGKRKVAAAEIREARKGMNDLLRQIFREANITDKNEQQLLAQQMGRQFNDFSVEIMKRGAEVNRELALLKISEDEKAAIINGVMGAGQGIGFAIASNLGGGGAGPTADGSAGVTAEAGAAAMPASTPAQSISPRQEFGETYTGGFDDPSKYGGFA